MKVIFLDNDGVICLASNWGGRFKKQKEWGGRKLSMTQKEIPLEYRFDDFDKKAIKVLNDILKKTNAEIIVSSDWRTFATLEELGEYYLSQGIIKKPIAFTDSILYENYEDFPWHRAVDLEQTRSLEISEYLGKNTHITHWVAIDDLNMGKTGIHYSMEFEHEWALDNFNLRWIEAGVYQENLASQKAFVS